MAGEELDYGPPPSYRLGRQIAPPASQRVKVMSSGSAMALTLGGPHLSSRNQGRRVGPTFPGGTVRGESPQRRIDNELGGSMEIINKDEFARAVAGRSGLQNSQAKAAVEATLEEITKQIAAGNEVRLTGFGKFSAAQREARQGRNPQTGETIQIAAKRVPKFSAGAELKKAVQ